MGDELNVVMEYIEGETLGALVDRLGATPDYARELYPALCDAVGELHAGFAIAGGDVGAGDPSRPQAVEYHRDRCQLYA